MLSNFLKSVKQILFKKSMLWGNLSWASSEELVVKLWLITALQYINSLQAHFILQIYIFYFHFSLLDSFFAKFAKFSDFFDPLR